MEIEFRGAAREVTGSCHIVRVNGQTIALDCGLFQGRRAESAAKNRALPLPVAELDAVVLSHAHIDHTGRLPFLVKEGYRQPIYCTPATRDLSAIMLADSARIQEVLGLTLSCRRQSADCLQHSSPNRAGRVACAARRPPSALDPRQVRYPSPLPWESKTHSPMVYVAFRARTAGSARHFG